MSADKYATMNSVSNLTA